MKKARLIIPALMGLAFLGAVAQGDFYVVPVQKQNYAPVGKTGQVQCYKAAEPWAPCICGTMDCPEGQDGDLQKGVNFPNPRFTDNLNGTVTDNMRGLLWTKDMNCWEPLPGGTDWSDALAYCNALAGGQCGLTDGSSAGDWRLPNVWELQSLINLRYVDPPLSNRVGDAQSTEGDPFTSLSVGWFWSSTTGQIPSQVWLVNFGGGHLMSLNRSDPGFRIWCVR